MIRRSFAVVAAIASCAIVATFGAEPAIARRAAAPPNTSFETVCPGDSARSRVAVVIDLGGGDLRASCVEFDGASITGLDALSRAGADPVVQGFGDIGGAICALCGVGCPAGGSCLTCAAPKYWGYYRRPAGTTGFTYSRVGAGSVPVHNGDVEGWSWGSGGDAPAPTTTRPAAPATTVAPPAGSGATVPPSDGTGSSDTGSPAPTVAPTPGSPGTPTATTAPGSAPVTTVAPGVDPNAPTTVTDPSSTTTTAADGDERALRSIASGRDPESSSTPVGAMALAAVLILGIVSTAAWFRLKRRPVPIDE